MSNHNVITSSPKKRKNVITKDLHQKNVITKDLQKTSLQTKTIRLFFSLFLVSVVGYIGSGFITPQALAWYDGLILSSMTPPHHWFGIAWGSLYFLMGFSVWMTWGKTSPRPFVIQLAFNLLWPFLFFHLQSPIMGLIDLTLMLVFIVITIWKFWKNSKVSSGLMIPVLLWSCFAFYLNLITVLYNTQVGIWLGII